MKVVILAGGLGTRLAEETELKPKPMVEIGGRPILWHIMKYYATFGHKDFIVLLGYKGEVIKRYFLEQASLQGNISIDMKSGKITTHDQITENWTVHLVETGQETNTGGRIARARDYIDNETFLLTYGDGVSNIDLDALLALHNQQKRIVTLTAVRPPARFGGLIFEGELIAHFTEKPQIGEGWINGGFMVMEPEIFDYIPSDETSLEMHVLDQLADERQLAAYRHADFWQCMDTLRDKRQLDSLWAEGKALWKTWD